MGIKKSRLDTAPGGLILFNKKEGITSFDALAEIKRALETGKVGHTGTLDKFARGLMPVLCGKALKLARWFSHCDKQYEGRIFFGVETATLDPEGEITARAAFPDKNIIESVLPRFTGNIMQAPPVFSAIKLNGQRASDMARLGQAPEMKKRPVMIYKLELRGWQPPYADIFVHCSSGTYVRSLARDIALAAGTRAHLYALKRIKVAGFELSENEAFSDKAYNFPLMRVNREVILKLGLSLFELSEFYKEHIIHGKDLSRILNINELKKPVSSYHPLNFPDYDNNGQNLTAALFAKDELLAIVEKINGKWKYGCVM
ncbi:MAG: tRNA pseudouridine(55) synthase TruB [Treponema sp.]|jgi:tRNA pseudouridine55 synthase|nr:tRNA pseudouridine(55) synthase TruB [Treponema sp.]